MAMKKSKSKGAVVRELTELEKRAKKIGVRKEQLDSFPDDAARKAFLDKISPKTNPDARPKSSDSVKTTTVFPDMPDKFKFVSKMEAQFVSQNRAQFDENELQAELRRIRRRYGSCDPVKIIMTKVFKPVDGVTKDKVQAKLLITGYEIFMV